MLLSFEQRHSVGGRACPQFGGGGGTTRSDTSTTNTDSRISLQSGTAISGSNNDVQITALDGGAIEKAFSFASGSLGQALSFASTSNKQALDTLTETTGALKDAYADAKGGGAMTGYLIFGAIAVVGVVAYMTLRRH